MSRYDALTAFLRQRNDQPVMLTFDELDQIIGGLPTSAKTYPEWWTNKEASQPHSRGWLRAGRRAKPNFHEQYAVFTVAGSPAGTESLQRPPLVQQAADQSPGPQGSGAKISSNVDRLRKIGFTEAGRWVLDGSGIAFELSELATSRNVLYAFITGGDVAYIGKSTQSLRGRMAGYRSPGPTQSTNIKSKAKIQEVLAGGGTVMIFALPDSGLLYYGGFHLNLAAGLEDSLVRDLNPPWNGGQKEPTGTIPAA